MAIGTLLLAGLAGILSILSPCVLPILPVVLGAALSEHRLGPVALAGGLALSFTIVGLIIAALGFALGLDLSTFRMAGAVILIAMGVVLMVPAMQMRLAAAGGPVGNWAEERFGGFSTTGLSGQFAVGLLLGVVWSPCVGPTLGAATLLASQGTHLGQVALTMLAFGIGAGLPLLLLGLLGRQVLMRWRDKLLGAGKGGKMLLGGFLLLIGLAVLTGFDKTIEAALVAASPDWLNNLTTRY
ncbi:MAG: cytochrome c biogenesis CcdA family protein [Bosea sp. (in: a-proteobacteria)]